MLLDIASEILEKATSFVSAVATEIEFNIEPAEARALSRNKNSAEEPDL